LGIRHDPRRIVGDQRGPRKVGASPRGLQPDDFKPIPTIGRGVEEIRIRDDSGNFRVIYTARLADAVLVLHAFQKKTQRTSQRDIEMAKARFREMMKDRK